MPGTISFLQQSFTSKPWFTEKDVPDLTGKVTIVTGSNTGLGKEIAQILYSKNAKVYVMARSEEKAMQAIESIKASAPDSKGELVFGRLDLADLTSLNSSAAEFLSKETKLDLLFNNAGVGYPGKGSKTKQGYELQLGVNCIGSFAFTKLLTPILVSTAKTAPKGSVRAIWVSSSAGEAVSPKNFVENLPTIMDRGAFEQYGLSKLGNYFHAAEFAARHKQDGVVAVSVNPGNLKSDFWRSSGTVLPWILGKTLLHPARHGAYTNLFAAFSPEVTLEKSGSYIAPWGRLWTVSKEMAAGVKTKAEGGTGIARSFWEWTDEQVTPYLNKHAE